MTLARTFAAAGIAFLTMAAGGETQTAPTQASAPASPEAAAEAVIDAAAAQLLAILSNEALVGDERLHAIEQIIHQRFDLEKMSGYVLDGRNARRLSEKQRAVYTCEFKPYLSRFIGSRFGRYEQEQVEILGAKTRKKGIVQVETRILGGRFDQGVVKFILIQGDDGEWRAIDASFEGVSVIKNLRAQIKDELEQGGPEHLLEMLREKNGAASSCVEI
jgi:phospholipid transport system substrate-binding protein